MDLDSCYAGLIQWEGHVTHMYRDSLGFCTVGVGNLLKTVSDAMKLPFQMLGKPCDDDVIAHAYERVMSMKPALAPSAYRLVPSVELIEDEIKRLCIARLEHEFLPGLRKHFPSFDQYPLPAQVCLVDIAYNVGVEGIGKFHNLIAACERQSWQRAAVESHVSSSRDERNRWRNRQLTSIMAVA